MVFRGVLVRFAGWQDSWAAQHLLGTCLKHRLKNEVVSDLLSATWPNGEEEGSSLEGASEAHVTWRFARFATCFHRFCIDVGCEIHGARCCNT